MDVSFIKNVSVKEAESDAWWQYIHWGRHVEPVAYNCHNGLADHSGLTAGGLKVSDTTVTMATSQKRRS